MPLFQQAVVKKYIHDLNKEKLQAAWLQFQLHFQNSAIQQNILNAKEEEYQEGFVRDLFVNILGYTLKPQPDYNLVMEQKSTSDATKSDGAILKAGNVTTVIELKDTGTTLLDKVEKQAFGYKHQHKHCVYVITSNFQQLRFYINDAIDYEAFDLFRLAKEEFALLYCCLQQQALLNNVPLLMKQQSVAEEENITKKLYADYSHFKKQLFADITQQNSAYNKLELFKKTQKLLDRFLFILFAEDRLLLPPNSVREILQQWEQLKELDNYVPLYDRFKKYFGYLNTGYQGKQYEIFAYNGGLFAPDEILDQIIINDQLLYDSCRTLSNYDFESEVDVNILGHIFEHSLSEIDEVERQLSVVVSPLSVGEGPGVRSVSKRKKDGVFYTPRYITKYIVENTIGALCTQKKEALQIVEEAFAPQKRKANAAQLLQKLDDYRQWLMQLTICDPACGSGAFLNQALEFLIAEHQQVDLLKSRLFGDAMILSDVENSILENNLYGVDINDEATEIAKLSLWLRTARKGRKLNSLNQHIKCGNSLIDDPEVAGDKAFNWHTAFPEVFAKGGFDVVIGNPPYVQSRSISEVEKIFYYTNYKTSEYQINLYGLFIEKGLTINKHKHLLGFIVPNYFISTKYDAKLRELIFMNNNCIELLNTYNVFEAAVVDTLILTIAKDSEPSQTIIKSIGSSLPTILSRLDAIANNNFEKNIMIDLKDKINYSKISFKSTINISATNELGDYFSLYMGMKPYEQGKGKPKQTREMMQNKVYHANSKETSSHYKLLTASSVKRHYIEWESEWIQYGDNLAAPRKMEIFINARILVTRIVSRDRLDCVFIEEPFVNNTDVFNLIPKENNNSVKTFYLIVSSKLCGYYFLTKNVNLDRDAFPKLNVNNLETFPVPAIETVKNEQFEKQADIMLSKNKELQQLKQQLLQLLQGKYESLTINKKLQDWPALSFSHFLKELEKQKIKLSLSEQAEWMHYFAAEKVKANTIQQLITETDKAIDDMVYSLYGLTEEERKVVEAG